MLVTACPERRLYLEIFATTIFGYQTLPSCNIRRGCGSGTTRDAGLSVARTQFQPRGEFTRLLVPPLGRHGLLGVPHCPLPAHPLTERRDQGRGTALFLLP